MRSCIACSDTVKKPKLDKHYMSCHSSVTCLDCSTTFAGPAQWKSHTSCISEAEKYQKGLYKGPKVRLSPLLSSLSRLVSTRVSGRLSRSSSKAPSPAEMAVRTATTTTAAAAHISPGDPVDKRQLAVMSLPWAHPCGCRLSQLSLPSPRSPRRRRL